MWQTIRSSPWPGTSDDCSSSPENQHKTPAGRVGRSRLSGAALYTPEPGDSSLEHVSPSFLCRDCNFWTSEKSKNKDVNIFILHNLEDAWWNARDPNSHYSGFCDKSDRFLQLTWALGQRTSLQSGNVYTANTKRHFSVCILRTKLLNNLWDWWSAVILRKAEVAPGSSLQGARTFGRVLLLPQWLQLLGISQLFFCWARLTGAHQRIRCLCGRWRGSTEVSRKATDLNGYDALLGSSDSPGLWTWVWLSPTHADSTASHSGSMPGTWPSHQSRWCERPTAACRGRWHHHRLSGGKKKHNKNSDFCNKKLRKNDILGGETWKLIMGIFRLN